MTMQRIPVIANGLQAHAWGTYIDTHGDGLSWPETSDIDGLDSDFTEVSEDWLVTHDGSEFGSFVTAMYELINVEEHSEFLPSILRIYGSSSTPRTDLATEDPHGITARLARLKTLVDRKADRNVPEELWDKRVGKPPDQSGLDWLSGQFSAHYSSELPKPSLYPTRIGGVQAEWTIGPYEVSLNFDLTTQLAKWDVLNFDTDETEERQLDMGDHSGWSWLAGELRRLQSKGPAKTKSFFRLGSSSGQVEVPDGFNRMHQDEIAEMFGTA